MPRAASVAASVLATAAALGDDTAVSMESPLMVLLTAPDCDAVDVALATESRMEPPEAAIPPSEPAGSDAPGDGVLALPPLPVPPATAAVAPAAAGAAAAAAAAFAAAAASALALALQAW